MSQYGHTTDTANVLLNAARELVELLRHRRDYSGRNIVLVLVYLGIYYSTLALT